MSSKNDFVIEDGVLKKYIGPGGDVTIPENVMSIGDSAFSGCSSLTNVTIPESVRSINNSAFSGCFSMKCVMIPKSVTSIGNSAFHRCGSLTSITIPEGVTSMGDSAFRGCSNLTNVRIPESMTNIGDSAFSGCFRLTNIIIPETLTNIGDFAFVDCSCLADPQGFVIVNGFLSYYCGSKERIIIPNSVTRIGNSVFRNCHSITHLKIPESVTIIGDFAFQDCTALTNIMIPGSVKEICKNAFSNCSNLTNATISEGVLRIGDSAFFDCSRLTSVTLPEGVTIIGNYTFSGCTSLTSISIPSSLIEVGRGVLYNCGKVQVKAANPKVLELFHERDFNISDNGMLRRYYGPGGNVKIPGGVTEIGRKVFSGCNSLTSVKIPDNVTSIGDYSFEGCKNLQWMISPIVPDSFSAPGLSFALLLRGERPSLQAYSAKADKDNLSDFAVQGRWKQYDLELINNGPKYKYKLPARLLGAIGRFWDPVELTEENRALYTELLNKNVKKLLPLAEEMNCPSILSTLFDEKVLDEKNARALLKIMKASQNPEIVAITTQWEKSPYIDKTTKTKDILLSPLQEEFTAKLKAMKGESVIKKMKLTGATMPILKLEDGGEAPAELFRYLLACYGDQNGELRLVPEADAAASLLAYDSLCEALDTVSNHLDIPAYPSLLPLLCRYGNTMQIRALINARESWGDWAKYGQKGYQAQEFFKTAIAYSDTHEAVVWLDKNSNLNRFAQLRDLTIADVYEKYLFDFGFDKKGKKIYDLGSSKVEVSLNRELKISLYDTLTGKKLGSLPKKNVDPSVYKQFADDLSDMKANIKKAVRIKTDQLFDEYLSGHAVPAAQWKKSYLNNPFLNTIGSLLVWEQVGHFFTLSESGPIDSYGQSYVITDDSIVLAHPMEMKSEDIISWQRFFNTCGIKQPFSQIWEPVYDCDEIREDRYENCPIHSYYLKNQEKRGIHVEWWENEWFEHHEFSIQGFELKASGKYDQQEKLELEILSLKPESWNRRANMIIGFLDRITVFDRVKKDDVSVMNQMQHFTLSQITDFIKLAQENNAVNILAQLLDFKDSHFIDFDPMDEYTLELI